jgi:hypothetical protein
MASSIATSRAPGLSKRQRNTDSAAAARLILGRIQRGAAVMFRGHFISDELQPQLPAHSKVIRVTID